MSRVYSDEDLARAVAVALSARGHDVVSTDEVQLKGRSVPKHLLWAASKRRLRVTSIRRHFELRHETRFV